MQIENREDRTCEIWLNNEEQRDKNVMASVKNICKSNKVNGIVTVIFCSGNGNLLFNTEGIVLHNLTL